MAVAKLCLSSPAHKTFPLMMVVPLVVDNCPLRLALNTVPYAIVYLVQMLLMLLQLKLFKMLLVLLQIEAFPDAVSTATNRNCSRCC
jgi:hypothetical protein